MLILKTAAFCLPLIGLGGIAGAVETGTSPVNAIIVFCTGCLVMLLYVKSDKAVCWRDEPAARGKERKLEKIEFLKMRKEMCETTIAHCKERIKSTEEELDIVDQMLNEVTGQQGSTITAQ